jgi:hypothetical protein
MHLCHTQLLDQTKTLQPSLQKDKIRKNGLESVPRHDVSVPESVYRVNLEFDQKNRGKARYKEYGRKRAPAITNTTKGNTT